MEFKYYNIAKIFNVTSNVTPFFIISWHTNKKCNVQKSNLISHTTKLMGIERIHATNHSFKVPNTLWYCVLTHTFKAIPHKYVRCAIKVVLGTTKSTTDYLFNSLLFGSSLFSSFVLNRRSHFLLKVEWDSIWSSNRKFVLFSRIKWCNKTF